MELRRLRLLYELSRRGTIAAVAEALSYSPSSVSVQLAELEREAGARLLRRTGRTLQLTAGGLAAGRSRGRGAAGRRGGPRRARRARRCAARTVRLTFVQTPALALLSRALATLAEAAPTCASRSSTARPRRRSTRCARAPSTSSSGIEYDPIPVPAPPRRRPPRPAPRRTCCWSCRSATRSRPAAPIALADVEHAAWAAGLRGTGHSAAVEHLCNRLGGYAPDIRHRTDDGLILRALVASGQAVTLLPALIATASPRSTRARSPRAPCTARSSPPHAPPQRRHRP